jgi:hypothetical protein
MWLGVEDIPDLHLPFGLVVWGSDTGGGWRRVLYPLAWNMGVGEPDARYIMGCNAQIVLDCDHFFPVDTVITIPIRIGNSQRGEPDKGYPKRIRQPDSDALFARADVGIAKARRRPTKQSRWELSAPRVRLSRYDSPVVVCHRAVDLAYPDGDDLGHTGSVYAGEEIRSGAETPDRLGILEVGVTGEADPPERGKVEVISAKVLGEDEADSLVLVVRAEVYKASSPISPVNVDGTIHDLVVDTYGGVTHRGMKRPPPWMDVGDMAQQGMLGAATDNSPQGASKRTRYGIFGALAGRSGNGFEGDDTTGILFKGTVPPERDKTLAPQNALSSGAGAQVGREVLDAPSHKRARLGEPPGTWESWIGAVIEGGSAADGFKTRPGLDRDKDGEAAGLAKVGRVGVPEQLASPVASSGSQLG